MSAVLDREDAIFFPSSLSASEPSPLIAFCHSVLAKASEPHTILDASELRFIDPMGLAAFRAALETVDRQQPEKEYSVRWMRPDVTQYLLQMDFFQGLEVVGLDQLAKELVPDDHKNCVELVCLDSGNSEEVASRLVNAMTGLDSEDECVVDASRYRRPIEYALKELLENSLSHAKRHGRGNASVWVACQHFAENGTVRLAIVDNGCGFLKTLQGHAQLQAPTHLGAIEAALIERVSCNRGPLLSYETDSQNQGVGLTTTARIAKAAGGTLVVASGNAWVNTANDVTWEMDDAQWDGVAIAFACQRDLLPSVSIPALLPRVDIDLEPDISFE
ncbi:ATP-binding protein [Pseudomonas oryzihabitans]|uniref:ATP-binding protein n=1 Tax=Pseudomonas oryzihabitans TaxID=47885 RepID=UPI003F957A2E